MAEEPRKVYPIRSVSRQTPVGVAPANAPAAVNERRPFPCLRPAPIADELSSPPVTPNVEKRNSIIQLAIAAIGFEEWFDTSMLWKVSRGIRGNALG